MEKWILLEDYLIPSYASHLASVSWCVYCINSIQLIMSTRYHSLTWVCAQSLVVPTNSTLVTPSTHLAMDWATQASINHGRVKRCRANPFMKTLHKRGDYMPESQHILLWYRSNWEELPKYQALDELSTINYQVTVTNTGSRSGAIAVLAYMTFTVCLTPLHYQSC